MLPEKHPPRAVHRPRSIFFVQEGWQLFLTGRLLRGVRFDALVGLAPPVVATGIATGWIGSRSAVGWNHVGLAMLLNAIGTVATSAPGPLNLDWTWSHTR